MTTRIVQTSAIALYSGMSATASFCVITPYPVDLDGNKLVIADFGDNPTFTIDPKVASYEEINGFTAIIDNGDNTATLTGLTRNLQGKYPYTASSAGGKGHGSTAAVVFSDNPQVFARFPAKDNDETITGLWSFPTPTASAHPATKGYVDTLYNGGSTTFDRLTTAGVAGETVVAGQVLYLKVSDGRWYKATSAAAATTDLLQLGIAQGAGTVGVSISGGVLLKGLDTHQTGMVTGTIYYLSTAGAISTSAGTVERAIGQGGASSNLIYFDPVFYYLPTAAQKAAFAGAGSTAPSSTNKFITQASLGGGGDGSDGDITISGGTTTLTRDMYYNSLTVNGTGILITAGYGVFVKGSLVVDGSSGAIIRNSGGNGGNGTNGTVGSGGTGGAAGAASGTGTFPGGFAGKVGGAATATATAGSAGSFSIISANGAAGGTGAAGSNGAAGAGAAGGTNTGTVTRTPRNAMNAYLLLEFPTATSVQRMGVNCGSSSGSGGGTGSGGFGGGGGGSGGSGGIVFIHARDITLTGAGCISANGGNGGNGGNPFDGTAGGGGGGGGGNGGVVFLLYKILSGTGTATANGGTKGAAGSTGFATPTAAADGAAGLVIQIIT